MRPRAFTSAWQRRPGEPPLLFGHRGVPAAAPENTLESYDVALEQGAVGVELDVRVAVDGELVVLHDRTLSRLTHGSDQRPIETLTARELRVIDLGGGARIPTLDEALAWAIDRGARLNIELKPDTGHALHLLRETVRKLQAVPDSPRRFLLSSFHPALVLGAQRALPLVPTAWLVYAEQRILRHAPGARALGIDALHPEHVLLTPDAIATFKRRVALVNTWTVNDPARARALADAGVDGIISDTPGALRAALDA